MAKSFDIGIDDRTFGKLSAQMRRRWGVAICATTPDGRIVLPRHPGKSGPTEEDRQLAINEALRWGEPTVQLVRDGRILWAMPLMRNAQLLGALVATTAEQAVFPDVSGRAALDVRGACADLRRAVEEANLTNAALLQRRREEYQREQKRAQAIHEFKLQEHYNIRQLYLRDEPELIAAVRRNDRGSAREILNRLLVAIHQRRQTALRQTVAPVKQIQSGYRSLPLAASKSLVCGS